MTAAAKPVLYLLPGLLCDGWIWRFQTEAFEAAYEIRIPDFTTFDTIEGMAEAVLDGAPEQFALAGHSMGARVAIEAYRRAPARVERLALLDTGVHPPRPGEAAQRQVLVDLADSQGMAALAERWLPPMVHPGRTGDPALMGGLEAMVLRRSPEIFRRQVRALLNRPDAAGVLPTIDCPVLIGVGRQDLWSPPEQHAAMAAAIPGADYVVFEDSGHMAPVETPDAVTGALRAWLEDPTRRA